MGNRGSSQQRATPDSAAPGTGGEDGEERGETPAATPAATSESPTIVDLNNAAILASANPSLAPLHQQDDFKFTPGSSRHDGLNLLATMCSNSFSTASPLQSACEAESMDVDEESQSPAAPEQTTEEASAARNLVAETASLIRRESNNSEVPAAAQPSSSGNMNTIDDSVSEDMFTSGPAKRMRMEERGDEVEAVSTTSSLSENSFVCPFDGECHKINSDILSMSLDEGGEEAKHTTSLATGVSGAERSDTNLAVREEEEEEDTEEAMEVEQADTRSQDPSEQRRMEQEALEFFNRHIWPDEQEQIDFDPEREDQEGSEVVPAAEQDFQETHVELPRDQQVAIQDDGQSSEVQEYATKEATKEEEHDNAPDEAEEQREIEKEESLEESSKSFSEEVQPNIAFVDESDVHVQIMEEEEEEISVQDSEPQCQQEEHEEEMGEAEETQQLQKPDELHEVHGAHEQPEARADHSKHETHMELVGNATPEVHVETQLEPWPHQAGGQEQEEQPELERHEERCPDQDGAPMGEEAASDQAHALEGGDHARHVEGPRHDWSQLPEPALLRLCGLVSDTDRCRMAAVCRSWSRQLRQACLWRARRLSIDLVSLRFLKARGKDIQHLTLTFQERMPRDILKAILERVQTLRLQSLTLRDPEWALRGRRGGEVLEELANVLDSQGSLQGLCLCGAGLSVQQGRALCLAAPRSLTDLNLRCFFQETAGQAPTSLKFSMWRWLKPYRNLRRLWLMYDYMSAEHMNALSAHKLGRTLETLGIEVTKLTPRCHQYPRTFWKRWTSVNPDLKVDLFLEDCPFKFVKGLVFECIPLRSLRLRLSEDNSMPDTEDSLNVTLDHVAKTCPQLQKLDVKDKELLGAGLEHGLTRVLSACPALQSLHVSAPLSLAFVQTLLQSQVSRQLQLQRTRITVQALEEGEIRTLNSMVRRFQPLLPCRVHTVVEPGIRIPPADQESAATAGAAAAAAAAAGPL